VVCTLPAVCDADTDVCSNGYNITGSELAWHGFDYDANCSIGYVGTASVTKCETSGEFNLTGCSRARLPPLYAEAKLRLAAAPTGATVVGGVVQWGTGDENFTAFESKFKENMALALEIAESRISDVVVTAAAGAGRRLQTGGVDVGFRITDTGSGTGKPSAQAMNDLQEAIAVAEERGTSFELGELSVDTSAGLDVTLYRDGEEVEWGDSVAVQESYYEISWDDVRTDQSCPDGLESGGSDYCITPMDNTVATCTCDLTAFVCDVTAEGGCGCDPDCEDTAAGDFLLGIGLLPEGTIENTVRYCADLDSANVDNHAFGSATLEDEGFTLATEFEENQLCVVKENSPSLGNFYTDPGEITSASASIETDHVMRISIDADDYSSVTNEYTFTAKSVSAPSSKEEYEYGDPLLALRSPVCTDLSDASSCTATGGSCVWNTGASPPCSRAVECSGGPDHIVLPTVGLNGACSDETGTAFGQGTSPTSCVRRPTGTLEDVCEYEFSARPYVGSSDEPRCFARKPDAKEPVQVVPRIRTHDGTVTLYPHDWTPASTSAIPETTYDAGAKVCKNAVAKVQYTVTHNGRGVVSEVEVELWYKDVTDAFTTQEFGVRYVGPKTETALAQAAGNERLERSGMPGYLPGTPVLSGRLATDSFTRSGGEEATKYAVEERVGGMAVVGMGHGGRCLGGARDVKYGHDAVGACTIALNRAELKTACEAQGTDSSGVTTLYTPLFNAADMVVGVFGDADPNKRAEWVELRQDGAVAPASWNEELGMCDRLVTGLSVTVYTAAVGNELEPQNKIVGVYHSYVTTPVTFAASNPNLRPEIELRTVVTFVDLPDRIMEEQVLAAPRIVPTMPADFFYPFTLSTSGAAPNGGVPLLAALAISLLLVRW
jgi:hypothetical protein